MFSLLKPFILFTLSTPFLAKFVTCQTLTNPISFDCDKNNGLYASNSSYHRNLKLVFSDVTNQSSTSLFNDSSSGGGDQDPATVYAQYYCRGDISTQLCHNCVTSAANFATTGSQCVGMISAVLWYENCTLRYENVSNVGEYDNTWTPDWWPSDGLNVSDQAKFEPVLSSLINTLIKKAAYGGDPKEFATGEANTTGNATVYCMVQCSPDMTGRFCEDCLTAGLTYLVNNFSGIPQQLFWFYPECQLRYSSLAPFYLLSAVAQTPAVPPSSPGISPPSEKHGKSNVTRIAIPVAVVSILLVCAASFGIWFCLSRRHINNSTHKQNQTFRDVMSDDSGIGNVECFSFTAIEEISMRFSQENKLGQGGFGTVYKGILPDGQQVAIKRLSKYSSQGIKEFKTEVAVVAKLQHRNLVRLLGFCVEQEEGILVYEFLSNLSLDKFLNDSTMSAKLDWKTRMKIIQGVSWGLRYLHVDSLLTVVHRDLKPSNILLDREMNPKIADFGMAKLVKISDTKGDTSRIAGTYGYMAPEYALNGRFSTKSDMYSFGVIIMEIISGKSISQFQDTDNDLDLLHQAWMVWNEKTIERLVDPSLENNYSKTEVERCLQIGLLCIQADASKRPTIRVVVSMLENSFLELPSPSPPISLFHSSDTSNVTAHSQGGKTESSMSSST